MAILGNNLKEKMMNNAQRVVVCAAVLCPDKTLLVGPRHYDLVMLQQYRRLELKFSESDCVSGFLDQHGEFLTREEAHELALKTGQIAAPTVTGKLRSEDLY